MQRLTDIWFTYTDWIRFFFNSNGIWTTIWSVLVLIWVISFLIFIPLHRLSIKNVLKSKKNLIDSVDRVIYLLSKAQYSLSQQQTLKYDPCFALMKTMFESMLNNDGPFYIHCLEGKDRTGYVCMVIVALCGASYDELVDDYFITYKNYYGIEKGSEKYNVIKELHIDEMIRYVFSFDKSVNLLGANYHSKANEYLKAIGLNQEQIDALQTKLSK